MGKLFGTDGVRGVANHELTAELAMRLGRAGAYVLTKAKSSSGAPKVLLGKDPRRSGDMLEAALAAGLCSLGAQVYQAGDVPTPAVAYLVQKYKFDAGVMISASHNPMQDNGIKFFNNVGQKLPDALEAEIEELIDEIQARDKLPRPTGEEIGVIRTSPTAVQDYAAYLRETVSGMTLDKDFTIVLDCANGATSRVVRHVFDALGVAVHYTHYTPDGSNINKDCGSTHLESLQAAVKENQAGIGLAFDGDGDRMLAVDSEGREIGGDVIMAICAMDMKKRGQLAKNTLVGTVMSNQGLDIFCRENGIKLLRTAVGDRYVLEKMLAEGYMLGGEQSGHVIFRQFADTGDGILTALQLVRAVAESGKPLSELRKIMTVYPQVLVNATINNARKNEIETHHAIVYTKATIEAKLAGRGRILVRPSGTEPLVRVMIEGEEQTQIAAWANELAAVIKENLQ